MAPLAQRDRPVRRARQEQRGLQVPPVPKVLPEPGFSRCLLPEARRTPPAASSASPTTRRSILRLPHKAARRTPAPAREERESTRAAELPMAPPTTSAWAEPASMRPAEMALPRWIPVGPDSMLMAARPAAPQAPAVLASRLTGAQAAKTMEATVSKDMEDQDPAVGVMEYTPRAAAASYRAMPAISMAT